MTNEELQQLKAAALAATPGPWDFDTAETPIRIAGGEVVGGDALPYGDVYTTREYETPEGPECLIIASEIGVANGRYLRAANPAAILALIAKIESLAAPSVASAALTDDQLASIWINRDCMDAIRAGDIRAQFICAARAAINASGPNAALVEALQSLYRGYVQMLEAGRDKILDLGGDCDPVDRMETDDPVLRKTRAALAAAGVSLEAK